MATITNLIKRDQENIQKYKAGEITDAEFERVADEVSRDFFELYMKEGFPKKDDDVSLYKNAVALTLHLPLAKIEKVYNFLKSQPAECTDPKDLAFMIDKIRVNKKQPQIYGTQFKKKDNGIIEFLPIEGDGNVDNRRAQVGLGSLEAYRKYAESI